MIFNESGDAIIPIKTAQVTKDVEFQKAQAELNKDIEGYFKERDKTNRGFETKTQEMSNAVQGEAEIKELLYNESLVDHPVPSTVRPMSNQVLLSARRNKVRTESGLWTPQATFGSISETDVAIDYQDVQQVMAVGNMVQELVPGMEVKINFEIFKRRTEGGNLGSVVRKEFEYAVPIVNIDGHEYIKISEREVDYITNTNGLTKEK